MMVVVLPVMPVFSFVVPMVIDDHSFFISHSQIIAIIAIKVFIDDDLSVVKSLHKFLERQHAILFSLIDQVFDNID